MTDRKALIEAIASALANARGARHGMPPLKNVLKMLKSLSGGKLVREVTEDAEAARFEGKGAPDRRPFSF